MLGREVDELEEVDWVVRLPPFATVDETGTSESSTLSAHLFSPWCNHRSEVLLLLTL